MDPSEVRELPPPVGPAAGVGVGVRMVPPGERLRSVALLAGSPDSCRIARRAARQLVHAWGLPVAADDVELAVSELVGNAVHHAAAPGGERSRVTVTFRARPGWWLLVEVSDEDASPPVLPAPGPVPLAEGGRGLFLVQSVADAVWWAPREAGGKSVCCRFDVAREGR